MVVRLATCFPALIYRAHLEALLVVVDIIHRTFLWEFLLLGRAEKDVVELPAHLLSRLDAEANLVCLRNGRRLLRREDCLLLFGFEVSMEHGKVLDSRLVVPEQGVVHASFFESIW